MANHHRRRNHKHQSLSFEARLRVFCTIAAVCIIGLVTAILALLHVSAGPGFAILGILLLALLLAFTAFIEEAVRPIQTLANVVAALREEDYSFRARGANREDALGQLSLEINALADTLQAQRLSALEAVALLRRVIAEMDGPVLAFDQESRLRLLNPAAERVFALLPARDLGKPAADLKLEALLAEPSETVVQLESHAALASASRTSDKSAQLARWMLRRSSFRQRGVPHTLVVLSDVSAALREEERLAWRRLIRVIGHEISNSLTPIKSIAGSLRSRLQPASNGTEPAHQAARQSEDATQGALRTPSPLQRDLNKGLSVIENRADSLNRFVQAYRQLAQLPAPVLRRVPLLPLLERVVSLEIRLNVRILAAPGCDLLADPDQIEQLLINLVRNAVEAAISGTFDEGTQTAEVSESRRKAQSAVKRSAAPEPPSPSVTILAIEQGDLVSIQIEDNGPGLANPDNLFVPLYTTKKSGSGVGLALARQIVEAHGGAIALRNRSDGTGCIAEVRIPIADRLKP